MMRTRLLILPLLAATLALAACGGDGDNETAATPEAAATEAPTEAAPEPTIEAEKPEISKPKGKAPTELVIRDIKEGTGSEAQDGQSVTVQYVGVSFKNGRQFDASWDRGEPFTFPLGQGQVISGWDQGVKGMKVGGRRELVIPPELGYGPAGSPPAIGPDETLIFVVDLVSVQ